jgi:F-type H+-transporting ATPase subunit epsilon
MVLKILLPFQIFAECQNVKRIVANTLQGSFGILPNRLDCVAALTPGILTFETDADLEHYVALDEGVLVKEGGNVFISVRNAVGGEDLGNLRATVAREFLKLDEQEKATRSVLTKLETGFLRRLAGLHRA